MTEIKTKERDAVIQSLRAGVVPRTGQHLIQVGRSRELEAFIHDLERVTDGGTMFRLVIGEYGSGKTFFLNLIRSIGLQKKLVTAHADLTSDRRLHATSGQARSLFAEMMRNISTITKPDGGALSAIIEKFINSAKSDMHGKAESCQVGLQEKLHALSEMVNGYDFATVIDAYWRGSESGQDHLKTNAVRWLRGEFTSKADAKLALGVRNIIDDASFYDQLKLMSKFVRLAGYNGLLVCLDEMVNLYKMSNTQARNANYEQILTILNDSHQGNTEGLGFIFGGTPEFLMDVRRGLYSYSALQSRLAENSFAKNGLVDFTHPVLRLPCLTPEELYVLVQKLRHVFAYGDKDKYLIDDEGLQAFMTHCRKQIGDAYFRTPRNTITAFVNLLAVLEQNPGTEWCNLLGDVKIEHDIGMTGDTFTDGLGGTKNEGNTEDELVNFKLH